MSKAIPAGSTAVPPPPNRAERTKACNPPPRGPNDSLILALYEQLLAARAAHWAFDAVSPAWGKTPVYHRIQDAMLRHSHREESLSEAICMVKADGPAGALVQVRVCLGYLDRDPPSGNEYHETHREMLLVHAQWSVLHVLSDFARVILSDTDGLAVSVYDPFRADVAEAVAEWREWFDERKDTAAAAPEPEVAA